jgi:hypothetical protein
VGICDIDENGDGIYDMVKQAGSYPTLCWRRCPLPQVWNGSQCTGSASIYSWSAAKAACEARGYRLPTAQEYMGPSIAAGILEGCTAVDLDWLCNSCSGSALCLDMFGQDEGQYWASTAKSYWGVTCHYKADFYTGSLNFHDASYSFGARCVK